MYKHRDEQGMANSETLKAIDELESGGGLTFASVEALAQDLECNSEDITREGAADLTVECNPISAVAEIEGYAGSTCQCTHCLNLKRMVHEYTSNHGTYKAHKYLAKREYNRVSLPDDSDHDGVTHA